MHRLPDDKLAAVLDIVGSGASARAVETATGVHRETVTAVLGRVHADRRRLAALLDTLEAKLRALGIDAATEDEILDLRAQLSWTCPVHPGADPDRDFSPDGEGCLLCSSEPHRRAASLRAHHAAKRADEAAAAHVVDKAAPISWQRAGLK